MEGTVLGAGDSAVGPAQAPTVIRLIFPDANIHQQNPFLLGVGAGLEKQRAGAQGVGR